MTADVESLISDLMSDKIPVDKRDFLTEKVKNGESISHSKTLWTIERLRKASDKVIDKLYEKSANPPSIEIDGKDALGKPICPAVIGVEGLETLMKQMPFVNSRYAVIAEKSKVD